MMENRRGWMSYVAIFAAAATSACAFDGEPLELVYNDFAVAEEASAEDLMGISESEGDELDPDVHTHDPQFEELPETAPGDDDEDDGVGFAHDYLVGPGVKKITGNRYRSLVAIAVQDSFGTRVCSAAVVSHAGMRSRYLLTAAHCVGRRSDPSTIQPARASDVVFVTSNRRVDPYAFPPFAYGVRRMEFEPSFQRACRGGCTVAQFQSRRARDVAILELDRDVVGARAARIRGGDVRNEQRVVAAGYGPTSLSDINPDGTIPRGRPFIAHFLPARVRKVGGPAFFSFEVGKIGVFGDSGCPVFDGNSEQVVGVQSHTRFGSRETFLARIDAGWAQRQLR